MGFPFDIQMNQATGMPEPKSAVSNRICELASTIGIGKVVRAGGKIPVLII